MANKGGNHRGEYTTTALWLRTKKQAKLAAGVLDCSMVEIIDQAVMEFCQVHNVPVREGMAEEAQDE